MAEVATHNVEFPISPENIPLPRSSMITVRLSDVQETSPLDHDRVGADIPQTLSAPQSRTSSTRSSRSSSQTSESSTSINTVDWDELEKTEEQESKDENTDEVSGASRLWAYHSQY